MDSEAGHNGEDKKLSWKRVGVTVWQATKDLFHDNGFEWAAAVSYYALVSTFPLLLAGIYIASLVTDPGFALRHGVHLLGKLLPTGEFQLQGIAEKAMMHRQAVGLGSVLVLLWSGSRVFGTLTKSLNIAYDVDETYGFLKRRLAELTMMLSVGVVFVLALSLPALLKLFWNLTNGDPRAQGPFHWLLTQAAPVVLLAAAFFGLFRFAARYRPSTLAALPGALLATALFIGARLAFRYYATQFGQYSQVYGSIAALVISLVWVWMATVLLLWCGELVSHIQGMLIEGKSAKEVEERHIKRSSGQGFNWRDVLDKLDREEDDQEESATGRGAEAREG
ncbi:MAG TPA: YihY/virulence factor BrkB family protein [Rhodothermales bacterium]|nr:YihY/virulence factor BrkB family protein [Rhodothermales bacterium]